MNKAFVEMLDTLGYDIELQEKYLADSKSGPCPCFKGVIQFLLKRTPQQDDFLPSDEWQVLR